MSKKKQIKTKALPVPQTREEAVKLLAAIGSDQRNANAITARATKKVLEIQLVTDEALKPINDGIDAKFQALHAWAEAHRHELLEGDAKTVNLPSGDISWRWTPPSVQIAKGKSSLVLQGLLDDDQTCEAFVRTSYEINKDAILDAHNSADKRWQELADGIEHLTFKRTELFAAKPLDMDQEYVETVKPTKAAKAVRK